jgi:hypothetical protein
MRTLRQKEQLDSRIRPVAQLALTSAGLVDAAVVDHVKPYAQANLLRAHAAILTTLLTLTTTTADEATALLLDVLSTPLGIGPMGDAPEDSWRPG